MGSSHQARRHSGPLAPHALLNYRVDDLSPDAFDSASGAFKPHDPQPIMPLPRDSGSDLGWTTVPSQQQHRHAPKPTTSLEPPRLVHEVPQGLPPSPNTSDSDPEDFICPVRAMVLVAGTPMPIFAPDNVETVVHLIDSADLEEEPVVITCSDVMEVLLASYEKKKKYETTVVILHQQLTDARTRIDSLERELQAAQNWPLVSESTQTDPPPALCNAGAQASPVL